MYVYSFYLYVLLISVLGEYFDMAWNYSTIQLQQRQQHRIKDKYSSRNCQGKDLSRELAFHRRG
jgi:hypothetical protein